MIDSLPHPTVYRTRGGNMPNRRRDQERALKEILLRHLAEVVPIHLPGTEGLTKSDVLREYPSLASSGTVPSLHELIRHHPHLAEAIDSFFSGQSGNAQKAP